MTKAYWVAHVDVHDAESYEGYRQANAAAFTKYGAKILVRGGPFEQCEGQTRARTVVIEFENIEIARACYNSPEYQHAKSLRTPCSDADLIIIEGWAG